VREIVNNADTINGRVQPEVWKRSTSNLPNADSEPILEIEMASANYCQVTGGLSRQGGKEKGENRKKAEIVPLQFEL
jgi:hypothetical protein